MLKTYFKEVPAMNKKHKAKKAYIIIAIIIIVTTILIKHNINSNKSKDINYAAKQYLTTGFFNSYKLYNVYYSHLVFSDSNDAILNVRGMQAKAPHATVSYKLKMSKNSSEVWHVNKVDPLSDVQYLEENN
jgi:hypothetical protein